jgi:hypothetical protein
MVSPSVETAFVAISVSIGMNSFMPVYVPWMIAMQFVVMMTFIIVSFTVVIMMLTNVWIDSIMIPA